jgi:hypothetical protein
MFVSDKTLTNIMDYIRRFHITDECTGARGHSHVSSYVHQLTDEAMRPRGQTVTAAWPIYVLANQ